MNDQPHRVQVTAPNGNAFEGTYVIAKGIMIVRSGDKKSNPVEVRQTDRQWLAKTVLLELHGHPRATWPEAWEPT